jgi:hypothetical protein
MDLMRMWGLGVCLVLAGCGRDLIFAPPPQKTLPAGPERPIVSGLIRMSDADADVYIGRDVLKDWLATRRWTKERPSFSIPINGETNRVIYMKFGIVDDTFRETGPVTIAMAVNGRELVAPRFEAAGDYEYRHAVPRELLKPSAQNSVELTIHPVYLAKRDGVKLGISLESIGLVPADR